MVRPQAQAPLQRRFAVPGVIALLGFLNAGLLESQTRHSRHLGHEQGLIPDLVAGLAQDHDGLLWIGTAGGLYRYDGVEMRRWAPDALRSWVSAIAVAPDGTLTVLDEDQGGVFTVVADGAVPVAGPGGEDLRGVTHLAVDRAGMLWALRNGELLSRDPAGDWATLHASRLDGSVLRRVIAARAGGAMVLTAAGVWLVTPGRDPQLLTRVEEPRSVHELADGRTILLTFDGRVLEVAGDHTALLFDLHTRGIDLAEREGTLWVSYDRFLAAIAPGAEPEVLDHADGVASGGPLLVDQEGTLWLGTVAGLLHFAEPDTRIWTERHGLPLAHTRYLAKTGDTVWVNTWGGTAAIARVGGRWRAWTIDGWSSSQRLFAGDDHVLRSGSATPIAGIVEVRGGRATRRYRRSTVRLYGFDVHTDGSEWFATQEGLLVAARPGAQPVRADGHPFPPDALIHAVLHDSRGRTWLASGLRICQALDVPASDLARATWLCETLPTGHHVTSMIELPGGVVWASFARGGVVQYRNGAWQRVDGVAPGLDIRGLVRSPSGGVWVVGAVTAARLIENVDSPDGWQVVESLSGWHGLSATGSEDILEEPDGTLWLTTNVGVARIPAATRPEPGAPRRVVLVDASVDEERVDLNAGLVLPHRRNRLTLRFVATSYRDPSLLRYQVRLSPDEPWTAVSGPPVFRWVDLRPGSYQAEVRASLDGRSWTAEPASFAFRVLSPWYQRPWALALFAATVVAAATVVYRARVAALLALERQRTRIALDLHDEIGSGLGSIGLVSDVLAAEAAPSSEARRLATTIADTAQELGTALSDIVWSLDPRAASLEQVAARLADNGTRLFMGDSVQFTARFPDAWPSALLDFPLRRAVLLIGLEALHNAARHARARNVTLTVRPDAAGRWQLVIDDDGCGLTDAARRGEAAGMGLRSQRRRAGEIGGRVTWSDRPGGGTRITLDFPLPAPAAARFT